MALAKCAASDILTAEPDRSAFQHRLPNASASPPAQSIDAPFKSFVRRSMKPLNFGCRWKSCRHRGKPLTTRSAIRLIAVWPGGGVGEGEGTSCSSNASALRFSIRSLPEAWQYSLLAAHRHRAVKPFRASGAEHTALPPWMP